MNTTVAPGFFLILSLLIEQQSSSGASRTSKFSIAVIAINGNFPGPIHEATTNWNIVVNVKNDLDGPLLLTWNVIQHRKNSWQYGVLGTNCPIPGGWNWTYRIEP
ncbi:monocopper oxidase-like protein SKS1 [Artemisia annua]|uniref:Monocopper oxidase-like protein SKS1 n=1 Tax=Artemisia annua TaxID=35608 RepID=A0A2U1MJU3_ARTAN|nr:monocopper oxidase-like protein SKS1 [Artemisia annua]